MKRPFFAIYFLVLLVGSFLGGAWYSQHATDRKQQGDRRILHYVDPMNPANISDKPGIAPCGMPMEPVYTDKDFAAGPDSPDPPLMSPGAVRISPQKQQIIGVKIGAVEKAPGTHVIRTLGRIVPDENRVHRLIAASDGWMWNLQGSTTGSLVKKDQIMAQIKIFSYDFFSWQQRFLTELGNAGRRQQPGQPYSGAWPPKGQQSGATQPGTPRTESPLIPPFQTQTTQPKGIPPTVFQYGESSPETPKPEPLRSKEQFPSPLRKSQAGIPQNGIVAPTETPLSASPFGETPPVMPHPVDPQPETLISVKPQPQRYQPAETQHPNKLSIAEYAASKAKLELLNFGVSETQIVDIERSGELKTSIELRSPVSGLVLSRGISPQQRVDRGTECFRVADLSRVWIIADVFNAEAHHIRPGMSAKISLPEQNSHYEARVSDVPPLFDATTRTLKVRLEMDNPKHTFRPEMFVDVNFQIALPSAITVPASAILDSGRKKTVFVALGDGYFEPRSVVTGWRFGDRVEIVDGLKPGDPIVISGNFLIDSESRIKLAAAGLSGKPENDPSQKTPRRLTNETPEDQSKMSAPDPAEHKHD